MSCFNLIYDMISRIYAPIIKLVFPSYANTMSLSMNKYSSISESILTSAYCSNNLAINGADSKNTFFASKKVFNMKAKLNTLDIM